MSSAPSTTRPPSFTITVRDNQTRRSKTLTVYGGTRETVFGRILNQFGKSDSRHAEGSAAQS